MTHGCQGACPHRLPSDRHGQGERSVLRFVVPDPILQRWASETLRLQREKEQRARLALAAV